MNYSELFLLVEETFEGNSWNEIDQILYPSSKFNVPQYHPCVASGDSDTAAMVTMWYMLVSQL